MLPFDLANWMLVFVRAGALLATVPVFSSQNIPVRLRIALGALIAFLVAPSLPPAPLADAHFLTLTGLLAMEAAIGLLLGFVSRMIFFALELTGSLIATEMGLNLSGALNPFNRDRSETVGMIVFSLGVLLLLTLNMHHWMLVGFQKSYALLPVGGAHLRAALFEDIVARTGQVFHAGLLMAAPVLAVTFLIGLILSVLGRAVPQMNVFQESFVFRALGALAMLGMTLNLMAQHLTNALRRIPEDMLNVARLLAG